MSLEDGLRKAYTLFQEKWVEKNNIERGSLVRVTYRAQDGELGWDGVWVKNMDSCVGRIYSIQDISGEKGIKIDTDVLPFPRGIFYFPFIVLEPVSQTTHFYVTVAVESENEEEATKLLSDNGFNVVSCKEN